MKSLAILLVCFALANCSNTSGQRGSQGMPVDPQMYEDRNYLWNAAGVLGEFDILAEERWQWDDPAGVQSQRGVRYRVRLLRYMPPRYRIEAGFPPEVGSETSFILITGQTVRGGETPFPAFDDRPGMARLVTGRRLLMFVQRNANPAIRFNIERAWRVDASIGVVVEPCVGFPAGTPVATILDPAQSQGASDAGFGDAPTQDAARSEDGG